MASSSISFSGSPRQGVSRFIHQLEAREQERRRTLDDIDAVRFAASSLRGPAGRWFKTLDADTQRSWTLLRAALLREYGSEAPPSFSPSATTSEHPPPPYCPEDPATRKGYIKLLGGDHRFIGYVARRDRWTDDTEEALVFRIPALPTKLQSVEILTSSGPEPLRVLGPRARRNPLKAVGSHGPNEWAFDMHINNLSDERYYMANSNCWLIFNDQLLLVWQYEDGSNDLLKIVKVKDAPTIGSLGIRSQVAAQEEQLRMVFEEDSSAGDAGLAGPRTELNSSGRPTRYGAFRRQSESEPRRSNGNLLAAYEYQVLLYS